MAPQNTTKFKISKGGDQTDKKNGKIQGFLTWCDLWPLISLLCVLKEPVIIIHPIKKLAKQSGLFSRDLDPRHRCYHLTSTFGEDCQACTCASVLFVLPNGSMTMSTGHKRGCNINEPHLFPCSASAIPHVQELTINPHSQHSATTGAGSKTLLL